jgi:D-xylose transport system substrate-binding protein
VASNDATAGGAIQALAAQKLAGKVPVSGQDADLAAVKRVIAGTQAMTVYKPLKVIATEAAACRSSWCAMKRRPSTPATTTA